MRKRRVSILEDERFNRIHSFRSSKQIDDLIEYWISFATLRSGVPMFSSEGEFIRKAIASFDNELRVCRANGEFFDRSF